VVTEERAPVGPHAATPVVVHDSVSEPESRVVYQRPGHGSGALQTGWLSVQPMAPSRRGPALLRRLEAPAVGLTVACCLAAIAFCVLVGTAVVLHPASAAAGHNPSSDYQIMTWSLAWWPWAVGHGVNPLYTRLLFAPSGFSTLWMTTIPVASLVALPLTLAAGPLVAFNVMMLLAVVLATGAGYLLCRELTGRTFPSLLGGLVFGLSPYMLGHALSQHLNLILVFPIPLLTMFVVRFVRGRTTARRFVIVFAALLLVLIGSSLELFVDFTFLALLAFAIAVLADGSQRRTLIRAGALVAAAYGACLPLLIPIAVLALFRPHAPLRSSPSDYATDLLNIVVPTSTLLVGAAHSTRAISQHFVGNIGERDGYLGIPLLAVSAAAVRRAWRSGAWITGAILLAALLLSLGPLLTVAGRPIAQIPFAVAHLPVLRDALPARFSVFVALSAACLCAIWFAHSHRRGIAPIVAAAVVASLLPNFWPAARVPGAWAVSNAFSWSTPHITGGPITRRWKDVIPPGSNVLVLPTGDRTPASYWQARAGMGFKLAFPATPFVPPRIAADPTVARLADDVLPQLDGVHLGGARLASFLRARHVETVVLTAAGQAHWSRLVRVATGSRPVHLNGTLVYHVAGARPLLTASGAISRAHSGKRWIAAWTRFDGERGHVLATVWSRGRGPRPVAELSTATADAEGTAAAVNEHGRAAVAFTEWRSHELLLRVATYARSRWRIATLDRRTEPIWSPRVIVTSNGTTLATWIDVTNPTRSVRVAVLPPNGRWQTSRTVDAGDGLGSVSVGASSNSVTVLAWHDSLANEERVQAIAYDNGSWTHRLTLAAGVERLDHVVVTPHAVFVRWRAHRSDGNTKVSRAVAFTALIPR
jgi:hypothetical protein